MSLIYMNAAWNWLDAADGQYQAGQPVRGNGLVKVGTIGTWAKEAAAETGKWVEVTFTGSLWAQVTETKNQAPFNIFSGSQEL